MVVCCADCCREHEEINGGRIEDLFSMVLGHLGHLGGDFYDV